MLAACGDGGGGSAGLSGCASNASAACATGIVPPPPGTPNLSSSVSSLVLAVNDVALSANLTGMPRVINVTNTGSATATSVAYTVSPALPTGTTIAPASCGDLAPLASCALTITPGATASAAPGDTGPVAITLTIAGTNTNSLGVSLQVLTYGSVYQSGYVFAVDDTAPGNVSIGGKVAALVDQTANAPWSATLDNIPGVSETSTTPCNGKLDGACDTAAIDGFYSSVSATSYAAGFCSATIGGLTDWYLPAICEVGYDNASGCGTSSAPTLQNMQSSLVDNGNMGGFNFANYYWSSTAYAAIPTNFAWMQVFEPTGASLQSGAVKSTVLNVRCARAMTP